MKILFFMRHHGYIRNFESTLRLLAQRGHVLHVVFEPFVGLEKQELLSRQTNPILALAEQYPHVTHSIAPLREDGWSFLGQKLRSARDYLRYLEPRYASAPKLRARARRRAPWVFRKLSDWSLLRTGFARSLTDLLLRTVQRAVPTSPKVDALIRGQAPDLVLVTPQIEIGSLQADYIRSAQALGIHTGLCVNSWDNLTNKGLIQDVPDLVTVWNDTMKREAVDLHHVPAERVVVTGASAYDHWFEWSASRTREGFCALVGLPADRPYLLYLCSSSFITPHETEFVRSWLREVRQAADPRLRGAGVLVRPHPQNARQWQEVDLSDLGPVAVWPRGGADPVEARLRADYFDSIFHCAAVVGVNTSALIESAIVGRPVHTLLTADFRDTQEGTLHFHHLVNVNGGLLRVAEGFEEHARQLVEAICADGAADARNRRFLEAFVRPYGLDEPAAPRMADAIERVANSPAPAPVPVPVWAVALKVLLVPLAGFMRWRRLRLHAQMASA